jgi:hypothetical protein
MKKILFAFMTLTFWTSCVKEGKKAEDETANHCPVISVLSVPAEVLAAFQTVYPKQTVLIWFKKDTAGYAAFFVNGGDQRKLAEFTPAGTFISEKIDVDYDGNFEDSTGLPASKASAICECVVPE